MHKTNSTDVDQLVEEIVMEEPIISENRKPQLAALIRSIFALINRTYR